MYQLMKGPFKKKRQILSLNLYLLAEVLLSLSEDVTFLKQIFEAVQRIF